MVILLFASTKAAIPQDQTGFTLFRLRKDILRNDGPVKRLSSKIKRYKKRPVPQRIPAFFSFSIHLLMMVIVAGCTPGEDAVIFMTPAFPFFDLMMANANPE